MASVNTTGRSNPSDYDKHGLRTIANTVLTTVILNSGRINFKLDQKRSVYISKDGEQWVLPKKLTHEPVDRQRSRKLHPVFRYSIILQPRTFYCQFDIFGSPSHCLNRSDDQRTSKYKF